MARRGSQTTRRDFSERCCQSRPIAVLQKMRRRKLKGGKQAVAGVVEDETTEAARLEKRVVRLSRRVRLRAAVAHVRSNCGLLRASEHAPRGLRRPRPSIRLAEIFGDGGRVAPERHRRERTLILHVRS